MYVLLSFYVSQLASMDEFCERGHLSKWACKHQLERAQACKKSMIWFEEARRKQL